MAVKEILQTLVPGQKAREAKKVEEKKLDKELAESFPTSDPPASVQPGSGITGCTATNPASTRRTARNSISR